MAVLVAVAGVSGLFDVARAQSGDDAMEKRFQFVQKTPAGLLRAAYTAQRLERLDEAKKLLEILLASQPSAGELRKLREEFGVGVFLTLNANPDLQPEAKSLLTAVNEASRTYAASDARLLDLCQQLGSSGPQASEAIVEIIAADDRAVAPLLANDVNSPQGKIAQRILEEHARSMRYGLLAALESADDQGRSRILKLLATTADPSIAKRLLRWRFGADVSAETQQEAANALTILNSAFEASLVSLVPNSSLAVENSDAAVRLLQKEVYRRLEASEERFSVTHVAGVTRQQKSADTKAELIKEALDFAHDAERIQPESSVAKSLTVLCESAARPIAFSPGDDGASPLDGPLDAQLKALHAALQIPVPGAAVALLHSLESQFTGDSISPELPTLLRQATLAVDPRVRVVASQIQLSRNLHQLNSEPALRVLRNISGGSIRPEAVVIEADAGRLPGLAARLEDAGYATQVSRTGADGFTLASEQLNCELILVSSNCIEWDLSPTIANLRADIRTQNCPIIVYGPSRARASVRRLIERYEGVWFMDEPFGNLTREESARLQNELMKTGLLKQADDSDSAEPTGGSTEMTFIERLRIAGVPEPLISSEERAVMIDLARSVLQPENVQATR
ncbi:MAG: hypothetical protein R3C20_22985 [Planctomycetaceae bacterium]